MRAFPLHLTGTTRLLTDSLQRALARQMLAGSAMATVELENVEVFVTRESQRFAWVVMVDGEPPLHAGGDANMFVAAVDAAHAAAQVLVTQRRKAA